ncbi:hypothetical protein TNCV_3023731 [Trichonephila clavipes]|nr:hypothetical protein TNCV_3023731 [Trichonephila clavipes]
MFDPSPFVNPTPRAHADTSRDVLPREGTSQPNFITLGLVVRKLEFFLSMAPPPPVTDCNPLISVDFRKIRSSRIFVQQKKNAFQISTLADGITRRDLFNVWNEEQDSKRKIDAVLSLVRSTTDFDKYKK